MPGPPINIEIEVVVVDEQGEENLVETYFIHVLTIMNGFKWGKAHNPS